MLGLEQEEADCGYPAVPCWISLPKGSGAFHPTGLDLYTARP
jgi:hypothetical protein